ncbi:N-acetylglucosamine repressor [Marinomonas spartinae]|uniref:ROK family transcriptional regulator n=1 Tax=Marinomonas spartinae TaxID=1792290 RepID=UPI000809169C|nr:ROK family transcriptional regulator [Marinomonas spartinae]SBS36768.1 N-acetylglucosamine repressor [Marinomonas spartinae]
MKSLGSTSEQSRIYNERIILHLVRRRPGISRVTIAEETGLSTQTISVITSSLLEHGLLQVSGKVRGKRGQPSVKLSINAQGAYGLGMNVDRDHISAVLLDFSGHCVLSLERDVPFPTEQVAKDIASELISEVKVRLQDDWVKVKGIGFAKPDYMDAWLDSLVTDSELRVDLARLQAELTYWQSDAFETWLASETGLMCYKENDAVAAATSELLFTQGNQVRHFFYLFVSIACGGSIVADGECYLGAHGKAGSFGLIPTLSGKHGRWILEALSLSSLKRFFAHHLHEYPQSHEAWQAPVVVGLIDRWSCEVAEEIQPALSAVIALHDPQMIMIGGRLPIVVVDQLICHMTRLLNQQSVLPVPTISVAQHTATGVTLGAAVLPLYETFAPQRDVLLLNTQYAK